MQHVTRQRRAVVALIRRLVDVAHVGGQAGNAHQAGLLVHHRQHFIDGHVVIVGNKLHNRRIAGAGTRAHDNAFQRGQTHRRVNALAVHHRGHGRTVAQMADDNLLADGAHAEELAHALAHIAVGRAVEAVAADAHFLIIAVRHAIHERLRGHGLMERGVEHGHLRRVRHDFLARLDAHQVRRIVQRAQRDELADGSLHFVGDDAAGGELLAAVQHAVTHRADFIHGLEHALFRVKQRAQHQLRRHDVVRNRLVEVDDLRHVRGLLVQVGAFNRDALHLPLDDHLLVVHVHQLVLQGGRTRVDNQNLHGWLHSFYFYQPDVSLIFFGGFYRRARFDRPVPCRAALRRHNDVALVGNDAGAPFQPVHHADVRHACRNDDFRQVWTHCERHRADRFDAFGQNDALDVVIIMERERVNDFDALREDDFFRRRNVGEAVQQSRSVRRHQQTVRLVEFERCVVLREGQRLQAIQPDEVQLLDFGQTARQRQVRQVVVKLKDAAVNLLQALRQVEIVQPHTAFQRSGRQSLQAVG